MAISHTSSTLSNSGDNQTSSEKPHLPNDMINRCIAHVPISYHPKASQVSKMINHFVVSREVYSVRSSISHSEPVLYIALLAPFGDRNDWYVLTKKLNTNEFLLREVPSFPPIPGAISSLITAGSKIYAIGGLKDGEFTSDVCAIDCTTYKTCILPKMKKGRHCPTQVVIDGTLYVIGGCGDDVSTSWIEALNLNKSASKWESVPCVHAKSLPSDRTVVVMKGKIYYLSTKGDCYVYDLKEDRLEKEEALGNRWYNYSCVIEDMLYVLGNGNQINVYDPNERVWRVLNGLQNLPVELGIMTKMVNYGGKLLLVIPAGDIWCIEISLERRGEEIWGNIVTSNRALSDPKKIIQRCLIVEI